jgi:outer membrane lipoprotein-sorting protein
MDGRRLFLLCLILGLVSTCAWVLASETGEQATKHASAGENADAAAEHASTWAGWAKEKIVEKLSTLTDVTARYNIILYPSFEKRRPLYTCSLVELIWREDDNNNTHERTLKQEGKII